MFNISGQNVNFVPGGPKKLAHFLYALSAYTLTSSNIDRYSNLIHCLNQKNICRPNNTITKDPTTPQMRRYTTFWNVCVLKATVGIKDDLYNI